MFLNKLFISLVFSLSLYLSLSACGHPERYIVEEIAEYTEVMDQSQHTDNTVLEQNSMKKDGIYRVNNELYIAIIDGKEHKCYNSTSFENYGGVVLGTPYREVLLTPEAYKAGIRVNLKYYESQHFGSYVLSYFNEKTNCTIWMEVLDSQEFSYRLGMNPNGISPFYKEQ